MEADSLWSASAYATIAVAGLVFYLIYRYVIVSRGQATIFTLEKWSGHVNVN